MAGISLRAYARHRRVTLSSVQAAVASGRITLEPDGSVDARRADLAWAHNTDTSKPRNSVSGTGGKPEKAAAPSFSAARARRESAQAELAELELARRRGELLDAESVRRDAFTCSRASRDRVLGQAARITPLIVLTNDPAEYARVFGILEAEARLVCEDMSQPERYGDEAAS